MWNAFVQALGLVIDPYVLWICFASAAYTDESYEMSKKGLLDLNLGVNLVFSVLGGLFGVAILIVCAPWLAELALNFSSFEYFWLAALGLTCAIFIATEDPLKGVASLLI